MAVKVLGPLDTGSEPLSPRERAILAALVVRAGLAVSPSELAEAYWGDRVPATWVQQVKTSVGRIRARLGREAVETVGSEYRLGLDPEAIDAVRFERLVSDARQHALRGEDDRAIDAYRRALAMWRGSAYADVPAWQPGVIEAMRLDEIRRSAQEELLDARLRNGEHRAVIADAERLVREDPLREDRWAILALATYRADRQAEALAVVRAARQRLADELGIDPGRRLTELETAILRQDPALAPVTTMRLASRDCPYRGLAAFGPEDAELFFGREADAELLVERARPGTLVAIVGPSGSGKSSLLLAGVLPRLEARGRTARVLRPGTATLTELRAAAASGTGVLAVDQAEELLRAGGEVDAFCEEAWRFLCGGGTVLLTVRSDFLDEATALPHVGAAVGRGVYALGPLTPDALRAAVVAPAERARLRLEPGLVEVVLRDTRPGALPHLSHALVETWVRREGATLTVAGYEAAGGIAGAIAQSAEDLYGSLGSDERELCRSVMLRLVERLPEGAAVRRRIAAAPLLDDPARRRLLERLVASRLVAVDGDSVSIVHESVATAWPRLAGWLDEDAEGGRLVAALATAAQAWSDGGRVDDDLARGARLATLLEWREAAHPDLTAVEAGFLDESAARERDEVRAVTERAAHDRRQNRRLRASLAGVAALLVVALAAGGIAVVRNAQAAASRQAAEREALVATSIALRDGDRDLAALLAAEAYRRWPDDPASRSALMSTAMASEGFLGGTTIPGAAGHSVGMAPIPGTGAVVVAQASGTLEVRDAATGTLDRTLESRLPEAVSDNHARLAVSADGSTLAVLLPAGGAALTPSFHDLRTGRQVGQALDPIPPAQGPAISPDGRFAAWVTNSAVLGVADRDANSVRTAGLDAPIDPSSGFAGVAAFTPDGVLLVGTVDGRLLEVDPATLAITGEIQSRPHALDQAVVPLRDGTVVASGETGLVRLDLATGAELWFQALGATSTEECLFPAVSQEHGLLFCAKYTDEIERRSLATGQELAEPLIYGASAAAGIYLLDEDTLLATPEISTLLGRWRIDGGGLTSRVIAPGLALRGRHYDPTGRYLLAGVRPGGGAYDFYWLGPPYSVWDATTGEKAFTLDREVTLASGAAYFATDPVWIGPGLVLVTLSTDLDHAGNASTGIRWIVDVRTGASRDAGDLPIGTCCVWLAPDGLVYAEGGTGAVQLRLEGGTLRRTGVDFALVGRLQGASFTPDGGRAAFTTNGDGPDQHLTSLYDTRSGALVGRGLPEAWYVALTPAGDVVGVGSEDLTLYDGATLERRRALRGSIGQAFDLQVSTDGTTLMAWVPGAVAQQLVDLRSGAMLGDGLPATSRWYEPGALRPDGRELAYTVAEGIAVWDLDPAHQFEAACRIAGRELTADEWATYLGGLGPQRATCAQVLG